MLRLASPNGVVTRPLLSTPPRDAKPSEIPTIDIAPIFGGSEEQRGAVARQIRDAATNTGFFYIRNHGVPSFLIEDAHRAGLDFFRQDREAKLKARTSGSNHFTGYFPPQSMKINPFEGPDAKEMFITRYDPRHDPKLAALALEGEEALMESIPAHIREHFHFEDTPWEGTASVPHFKPALIRYYQEGLKLTRALMRSFALSLDMAEDYFDAKMQYPNINTNINYYPPMASPGDRAAAPSSFGSHTDFQVLTVLWQDDTGGLQVLTREGQWINVPPVADTFVVNIADLMQRITNDVYVSTVHRAQNRTGRERVSMTFATGFGAHETVGVVDSCVAAGNGCRYGDITVEEWVTTRLSNMVRLQRELDGVAMVQ